MIQFENLEYGYSETNKIAVHLSEIETGMYFLIGANGSGKSTFLKTIFGEIKPINGRVIIDNENLINIPTLQRAQLTSYMSTAIPDVEYLKVRDFIALGKTPYMNVFGNSLKEDLLTETVFNDLDLHRFVDKYLTELSDGERQMFAVLKTLNQDTSIILLDEPTSFLDPKNKRTLLNFLQKFAVEKNKTIIISTHDVEITLLFDSQHLVIKNKSMFLNKNMDLESILEIY